MKQATIWHPLIVYRCFAREVMIIAGTRYKAVSENGLWLRDH